MRTLLFIVFCLGLAVVIFSNYDSASNIGTDDYKDCNSCTEAGYSWCELNNGIFWQGRCLSSFESCPYDGRSTNETFQCDCFKLWSCDTCLDNDNCAWCDGMKTCAGRYNPCSSAC